MPHFPEKIKRGISSYVEKTSADRENTKSLIIISLDCHIPACLRDRHLHIMPHYFHVAFYESRVKLSEPLINHDLPDFLKCHICIILKSLYTVCFSTKGVAGFVNVPDPCSYAANGVPEKMGRADRYQQNEGGSGVQRALAADHGV